MRENAGKKTTKSKITQANTGDQIALDQIWSAFTQKLGSVIGGQNEDDCLIISEKHNGYYVQVAVQGSYGFRLETTSDHYRSETDQLTKDQVAALKALGWRAPTKSASQSDPTKDPLGSPNWYRDVELPFEITNLAELFVATLRQVLGITHPGYLQYQAFNSFGNPIALPELGLKVAIADTFPSRDTLNGLLLEAAKSATQIDCLALNADESIGGITFGNCVTFVRLVDADPPEARMSAALIRGIEESHSLLKALNAMNAEEGGLHVFATCGDVVAVKNVNVAPFSAAVVASALEQFCTVADSLSQRLQLEFTSEDVTSESSSIRH